ncbi:MAG TPA: hypothetical protein VNQ73_11200 [Ilumatobacter sp.]|nr:hypothetical protein [Ilumatobacter sp.]
MAKRADDLANDPVVVLIEEPEGDVDEWLRSLRWGEALDLEVTAAELLAEARTEDEWSDS